MKKFLLFILLFPAITIKAQKFVLLDQHISEPVKYANTISASDKFNDLFP